MVEYWLGASARQSGFTEKEMQHIYNERERADDYAKCNVKTIIVGYGKNGI